MKKYYALTVRGKRKEWCFIIDADSKYLNDWREDGLNIGEVVNIIPQWYVNLGLPLKLWCFIQNIIWKISF